MSKLPTLDELTRVELRQEDRDLIRHFANNALAVILANSSYLAQSSHLIRCSDPAVEQDVRSAAADLVPAAEELAQVIRLLGVGLPGKAVGEVDDDDGPGEDADLDPVPGAHR